MPSLCVMVSLFMTILLMNLINVFLLSESVNRTGEFYKVFWLMPPGFVGVVTVLIWKKNRW